MIKIAVLSVLSCVAAVSVLAAGICGNENLSIAPGAVVLAPDGECIVADGFAEAGMFKRQGLSSKRLTMEIGGTDGALKLVCIATNMCDTYWSVLSRPIDLPGKGARRFRLAFHVTSGILLSCGAHENGIWRNLLFWLDGQGREIGYSPLVFSVSGKSESEVSVVGDIPAAAVKCRLQLGFDGPNILPGRSVVYRGLRLYVLPEKNAFMRRGQFVSRLHAGGKVSWRASVPKRTAIAFQAASGATAEEALSAPFTGPDGTGRTFYRKPFEVKAPFMRYKALLASADGKSTPSLESVSAGGRTDSGWSLLCDCSPPLVHLGSDSPFTDPMAELRFEMLDESLVTRGSLRVSVDGVDRTAEARWHGNAVTLAPPAGGWQKGRHEALVYLADGYGYAREARKYFFRGEAPSTPKVTLRHDGFALVDGKVFFPIGLFDVRKNAFNAWNWDRAVGDLAKAGFNFVHSYGTSAFDPPFRAAIRKYGMMHWISSGPWQKTFEDTDRHDPSLLAWYLADDTSRNTSPEELFDRVEAVRAFDPTKLTTHAEHVGRSEVSVTRPYVDKIDGLMAEIYPIREDTPEVASNCVARVISDMRRHASDVREGGGGKPRFIWPIIQNFQGWGSWKRVPTTSELRAMSYAALIHGAHGITWYKYNDQVDPEKKKFNRGVISSEARWRDMTNLVAEIKALVPVITEGKAAPDVSCRVTSGPAVDPHGHPAVTFMARRHGGRLYVISVNSVRAPVTACFTAPSLPTVREVRQWRTDRRLRMNGVHGWTDRMSPFAVRVYVIDGNPARQEPFSFRKKLESPHVPGRRDVTLKPAADEFVFTDGCEVPNGDFADYLKVSMGVKAKVGGNGPVRIRVDSSLREREYRIDVSDAGVSIVAFDDRASRRALYHLEDLMNLRRAPFLKKGSVTRRPVFSPRMSHSGWALDEFPDGHLSQLAHHGIDAILVFVEGIDRTKGGRRHDIADLIRRAAGFGLDTYIYSYITAFAHPDDPGAQKVFDDTYGKVAAAYPDAKGIVFVGESAEFPSKDERTSGMSAKETRKRGDKRPAAGRFPSRDYPDWINAVKRTLHERSPGMEFVFWTYNWGGEKEDLRLEFIKALPKDVTLMATFEMYERHKKRNGLNARIDDYSLCVPGPGKYFASEAAEAKRRGLRLYTMSNTGGLTWDFGTVPYLPMPFQWKKRWDALKTANREWGLSGLMENHHYGWYPSFVSELAKEALTEGGIPFETHIRMIAARDFGEKNAESAVQAWKLWSTVIEDYVATSANQYGPFRIGPAYPFNALRERIDNLKVEWPKDALNSRYICRQNYLESNFQNTGRRVKCYIPSVKKELELLSGMEERLQLGVNAFRAMGVPAALEMADFGEYLMRAVVTAANVKRGAVAETVALDEKRPEAERAAAREEIERLAAAEYKNAEAAIPLVERNSRLGWEPTMGYAGGADMIRVKLDRMKKRYRISD